MGPRSTHPGVTIIEPRTIIAYALIALLIVAVTGFIYYLRYNSYHQQEKRRWRARQEGPKKPSP